MKLVALTLRKCASLCVPKELGKRSPKLEGKLDPEELLHWLHTVVRVFECKDIPEEKKVKLVALRLRKCAGLWWTNLFAKKALTRHPPIHPIHLRFLHEF